MRTDPLGDSEAAASSWISMCDVFLLFSVLVLALFLAQSRLTQAQNAQEEQGNRRITTLEGERLKFSVQLAKREADLDNAKKENDRLKRELRTYKDELATLRTKGSLGAQVARQRQEIAALEVEVDRQKAVAFEKTQELADSKKQTRGLMKTVEQLGRERAGRIATISNLNKDNEQLKRELRSERTTHNQVLARKSDRTRREGAIRQELLGITGGLDRVLFVFDHSSSMYKSGRWDEAKNTAKLWLNYLPVGEAALILFSNDVKTFPSRRRLLEVNADTRQQMIERLDATKPRSGTKTLAALETAYQYRDIDAIVLFTDGRPAREPGARYGGSTAFDQVYGLVEHNRTRHPSVRIHTVAVGGYFDESLSAFLLKLAEMTDGAFLGR